MPQEPRVEAERLPDHMLSAWACVESEDEIVPRVVFVRDARDVTRLSHGFRQEECAPIGEAADNASRREDERAGRLGYADFVFVRMCCGWGLGRNVDLLLHFIDAPRADLVYCQSRVVG